MSVFTMVAIIVVVSVVGGVMSKYFETTEGRTKSGATENYVRSLRVDVERLQDRVHTLERILTDEDRDLRNGFRDLA
ncbi:MAG: hypothetical protein ACRBEQ_00555 [Hyphomonas sp.]